MSKSYRFIQDFSVGEKEVRLTVYFTHSPAQKETLTCPEFEAEIEIDKVTGDISIEDYEQYIDTGDGIIDGACWEYLEGLNDE